MCISSHPHTTTHAGEKSQHSQERRRKTLSTMPCSVASKSLPKEGLLGALSLSFLLVVALLRRIFPTPSPSSDLLILLKHPAGLPRFQTRANTVGTVPSPLPGKYGCTYL